MAINAALRSQHGGAARTRPERTAALVVCNDDRLLIELGPLLGDRYRVHAVDTLANIGGQLPLARWIGIVDADSQAGARSAVARLEVQYPLCPLIVISERPEEWVDSVARGAVLVAIGRDQVATARLSEALLDAEHRLRADGAGDAAARDASAAGARPDRLGGTPQWRGAVWTSAALLLMVLCVSGIWLYHRHLSGRIAPAAGPAPASGGDAAVPTGSVAASSEDASPPAPRAQNVLELLSAARIAFRDQRLLPPRSDGPWHGDSALELYAQVLSQDPQNDEALAGVQRLLVVGRDRITTDAASGQLDDANRLLGLFKAAAVDADDLRQLASAISAARPKWLAQRAAQDIAAGDFSRADQELEQAVASGADRGAVQALRSDEAAKRLKLQLTAMATQVDRAVQAGALLPPARDSALARLAAMRSMARGHPLTLEAQYEVQVALVQAGEQATRTAQFSLAQRDLNAAAELGSFAPLTYARRQLQEAKAGAQRPAAFTGQALQRAQAAAAVIAPSAAAGALTAASPPPRPYIVARPTRALPVSYPYGVDDANGTVIVEFTLSANGSASDATVVQSDLPRVFDRAAISAVQHGRYSTQELVDGQPARARIKLRFVTTEG